MQTSTDLRNLLARIDRKGYPAYKDTRGAYQFPRLRAVHRPRTGGPLCRSLQIEHPCERKAGRIPQAALSDPLPAHRPSGCAHPPVWPAGGPGLLSGQGLGTQRPHLYQPVRPGGAGADRLRPGPGARRSAAAAGGGLPRQRPHHQRPGAGKDPLRPAAPVRGGVPALPQSGRKAPPGSG